MSGASHLTPDELAMLLEGFAPPPVQRSVHCCMANFLRPYSLCYSAPGA